MTDEEKLAHMEMCLSELIERTSVSERIVAIENFRHGIGPEMLIELFDIVYQTHS